MNKLLIAKHSVTGQIIDVQNADNGLSCNCLCLCCGDRLVAKQGNINIWHFSHESGADCTGARESALHLAAKQIIQQEQIIYVGKYNIFERIILELDDKQLSFENQYGQPISCKQTLLDTSIEDLFSLVKPDTFQRFSESIKSCEREQLTLYNVELEKRVSTAGLIPDVSCFYDNNQPLFIEIVVTHQCELTKLNILKALNIPVIEIYLSSLMKENFTLSDIRQALTQGVYKSGNELIKSNISNDKFKHAWLVKPDYLLNAEQCAKQLIFEIIEIFTQKENLLKIARLAKEKQNQDNWEKEQLLRRQKEKSQTKLRLFNLTIIITEKPNQLLIWIPYVENKDIYNLISKVLMIYGGKRIQDIQNWVIKNVQHKHKLIQSLNEADSFWRKRNSLSSHTIRTKIIDGKLVYEYQELVVDNSADRNKLIVNIIEKETNKIKEYFSGDIKIAEEINKTTEDLNSLTYDQLLVILQNY